MSYRVLKTEEGNLRFLGPGGGLYGSASPLPNGIAHIMKVTGCSLVDALKMTTLNAANLLNLNDRGVLEPGRRADIILFSMDNGKMVINNKILKAFLG